MMVDESKYEWEWISVSELAKRLGITTQQVYNRIKDGMYETINYQRGSMNGYLVKVKKENL